MSETEGPQGRLGHEVVFVYEAEPVDESIYEREEFDIEEPELADTVRAVWRPLSTFRDGAMPLYPNGLLELLGPTPSR